MSHDKFCLPIFINDTNDVTANLNRNHSKGNCHWQGTTFFKPG
jgi:hypothetical protein